MANPIKLTDETIEDVLSEIKEALQNLKMQDGEISFKKSFSQKDKKATIIFSPTAYNKMIKLIMDFDSEVAWHGVAERTEENNVFLISDILVYPQIISSATVQTDQKEYEDWLMGLDDYTFSNLRMQGHSHVKMGVSPSSTDTNHQKEILNMLDDSMFYIFMIWNKSLDCYVSIYDLRENILYEKSDISIEIRGDGLEEFIKEAKELAKPESKVNYAIKVSAKPQDFYKDEEEDDIDVYLSGFWNGRYDACYWE